MSTFFDEDNFFPTTYVPTEGSRNQQVLIGSGLWHDLNPKNETSVVFVSISFPALGRTISCWAGISDHDSRHVFVCSEWLQLRLQNIIPVPIRGPCQVTPTRPVPLTEIFVSPLSQHAYRVAQEQRSQLVASLMAPHTLLRQGEVYRFLPQQINGVDGPHEQVEYEFRFDMLAPVLQGVATQRTRVLILDFFPSDSSLRTGSIGTDEEDIEIGDEFLASTAMQSPLGGDLPHQNTRTLSEVIMNCEALSRPVSAFNEDHVLYLRTTDLSQVGLLHGDWAVCYPAGSSKYRLVRIQANDRIVGLSRSLCGSPDLLRNIVSENSPLEKISICLRPSPFGSAEPVIPTAQAVTIARISSPFSINRKYQSAFTNALKTYFGSNKRIVKQGDIISVAIDTDDVEDASQSTPGSRPRVNEPVHFLITNIEYPVLVAGQESFRPDVYTGSTTGELGCWVDTNVTKIIQTGVEHGFVPNVARYLGSCDVADISLDDTGNSAFAKLLHLCSAILDPRSVNYSLHLSVLFKGVRGIGKFSTAKQVARRLGLHILEVNLYDVIEDNVTQTEGTLRVHFDKAEACSPCLVVLRHVDALSEATQIPETDKDPPIITVLREWMSTLQQVWRRTGYPVIVCGTITENQNVPTGLQACFKHELTFEAPTEKERRALLQVMLNDQVLSPDVSLDDIAVKTAALVASDLRDLVLRAQAAALKRAIDSSVGFTRTELQIAGISLTSEDFGVALGSARMLYSESIGAPQIPQVSWDDVGGLAHVKRDILDTMQLPLEHPELFAHGLKKRSGILLYGPPGTGKTLVAKAVATSFSLNFFSVKGPELLNMYIGESEANVRRVFQRARDAKPCVIFFDELDSIAPKRGNQGDSGGVMDRIVSQLLAELDGINGGDGGADVFVLGATNRPDLLDPALLRPGRFDRLLYLGVSETHEAQLNILKALTRKFPVDASLDLTKVAEQCPFNYTGADFYALCSDALLNAMTRTAENLENKIAELNEQPKQEHHPYPLTPQYYLAEMAKPEDFRVLVTQTDFLRALASLIPSVSKEEMAHYATIQGRFGESRK